MFENKARLLVSAAAHRLEVSVVMFGIRLCLKMGYPGRYPKKSHGVDHHCHEQYDYLVGGLEHFYFSIYWE